VFEIMEVASRLKLSIVPVLDEQKNFLGVITLMELLHYFAELSALRSPGGIIVIELNSNDFSMSQIAQIVEGNDAKILSAYISSHPDSTKLELTLKLNVTELTSIIQTFNRYNYTIRGSYMKHDDEADLLDERYDLLMRYLNI